MKTALLVIGIAFAVTAVSATSEASANHVAVSSKKARHARPVERAERDCTPINGRFGYYGNPWCDTGSSRPPDIDFRERQRMRGW
ncbi:hypothetical protein [Hyphomicrobium sp. 99]|uniref:hypothetical protein n=1 Tax=Hyphomicrobium sp. 99 TaxID=1163419 RepID=UPI001FD96E28|nr:hypothetical protein [Hyphomicrobium sp. 99]